MKIIPISLHHVSLLFLFFLKVSAQPSNNDQSQQPQLNNLTPSMAIIIVILIAALFLMGFFSIYIRHCADSPSGGSIRALGLRSSLRRSRRPPRGLDPLVLQSFPTLQYSLVKAHKVGKGALECAVCLSEFDDSETLRLIPLCDHVFHPDCIDEWLSTHTTCPVCRADLVPKPDQSLHEVPDAAQNDVVVVEAEPEPRQQPQPEEESDVACLNQRSRTRGSRSGRARWFPRSHSTGHSLVQPGEDTERFTLRLPVEVRNQIMNRKFQRATSLIVLPTEGSSRRGYRISGDGSSRGGRYYSSRRLDRGIKSDRWVFTMAPPFLVRASSIVRSPKVGGSAGEGTSGQTIGPAADVARLPV